MGISLRGFLAWWLRRSYYLLVTPRMSQRARLMADWTIGLFFPPPLSKLDLNTERDMLFDYAAGARALNESAAAPQNIASRESRL